jgi:hypothetical protein
MAKTVGAVTKNKGINWRVKYYNREEKIYTNLADLCAEENINRSSVYKIAIGKSSPTRKKHLLSIEKIYNDNI